jgi:cell wall assembly regulator SMI1
MLEAFFDEIDKLPIGVEPCDDPESIDRLEEECGYRLPEDLKAFYRRYRSVTICDSEEELSRGCCNCRFVPVSKMHRTRIDIYGEDIDYYGPSTWITVCNINDGNYIALDLASGEGNERNYILCDHEVFAEPGESPVIARCFTELLKRVLHGPSFWIGSGFMTYGDALPLTPETASRRIENPEAPRKGWLVKFAHKGRAYSELFADEDYGGKEQSFAAVREMVERAAKVS